MALEMLQVPFGDLQPVSEPAARPQSVKRLAGARAPTSPSRPPRLAAQGIKTVPLLNDPPLGYLRDVKAALLDRLKGKSDPLDQKVAAAGVLNDQPTSSSTPSSVS